MASDNYPLGKKGAIIGSPYAGTHSKAFNIKGGSNNWQSENAVDIAVPVGTPVYAVADGVIGSQIGSQGRGGRFAGERLTLTMQGNAAWYGHLSQIVVKAGQKVVAGQLLGYSGEANGAAHLHFAVQKGDPAAYLRGTVPAGQPAQQPAAQQPTATMPTDNTQQPTVTPPPQTTPPTGAATPTVPGLPIAGGTDFFIQPTNPAEAWQTIAQLPDLSPETQRMIQLAGAQ